MTTKTPHQYPLTFSEQQNKQIEQIILAMATRIGSPLVMITDISGRLILYHGRLSLAQGTGLGALSAGGFAAGVEIGNFLGLRRGKRFNQLLLEGDAANLYITRVGDELLLITAFTQQTTLGMVRIFVDQSRKELMVLVEEAIKARELAEHDSSLAVGDGFSADVGRQLDELFYSGLE
ncbi:MAG: roadblock/LC7 domain-containing protein [Anaerolineales bacterium]|nr:roadblock/LC7 domain-containing protein [Anaerolineales bacterium]MCB0016807.1 roadblock/LC7 domain-containing protein [Anaerolineales bacterium]MCB0029067.1 roadblock/LC7 domain-containing protein [Anaerolineales bacterium]MCB8961950.1 roadblock/LC7 domain-containing protein [Ardenticatenales bacterium]